MGSLVAGGRTAGRARAPSIILYLSSPLSLELES